jgi:hypothetical protein
MTNRHPVSYCLGYLKNSSLDLCYSLTASLLHRNILNTDTAMLRCSLTSDRNETNVEHNQQFSLFNKLHLKKIDSSISELKTAKMLFVFANKFKWLENLNTQADEK